MSGQQLDAPIDTLNKFDRAFHQHAVLAARRAAIYPTRQLYGRQVVNFIADLRDALRGSAAAFRSVTRLQPSGGVGDKVFPPTYSGGRYATEQRKLPGEVFPVDCVLLDSVQSRANRMELALLDAWENNGLQLPVVSVDFSNQGLPKPLRVTSLEAPHRIVDALLRDSLLDAVPFRKSSRGQSLDHVDIRNATALLELCPTALLFGLWDSTRLRGGVGVKFARVVVSEIVGIDAIAGVKTSSRIDPAEILRSAGPLFRTPDGDWTLDPTQAIDKGGKKALFKQRNGQDVFYDLKVDAAKLPDEGRPSVVNHGNIPPDISAGGVTIRYAQQTTTLSLPALRRLRFPLDGVTKPEYDIAARTALAALGLCAATLCHEAGNDLRSRCHLVPESPCGWELIDQPGTNPKQFRLNSQQAIALANEAIDAAKAIGLPWLDAELKLTPSPQLVALVKRSQELTSSIAETDGET